MSAKDLILLPEESHLKGVLYSLFDDEGPSPRFVYPEDLDYGWQLQIAMKTISLMMGERVYQDGDRFEDVKYYGILPFPDFGLHALTLFFLLRDENARGQAKAATITLLAEERHRNFLYEDMQYLQSVLYSAALKIRPDLAEDELGVIFFALIHDVGEYLKNKASPLVTDRKYKLLFAGLDNAGKTSFLLGIQQKYSELLGTTPTYGLTQSHLEIFGTHLYEWEVGGQVHYRTAVLSSGVILYDTDVLFYLVDAQDPARFGESIEFFQSLVEFLQYNEMHVLIVICFHKVDPDVHDDPAIRTAVETGEEQFLAVAGNWPVKFFETSIFDHWSLVQAFSYGVAHLSPNRDIFRLQLQWLGEKLDAAGIYLLNESGFILSDYVHDEPACQILETATPYIYSLFKTFRRGTSFQTDRVLWKINSHTLVFLQRSVLQYTIYLLILSESEDVLTILNDNLGEFEDRISGFIENYL